MSSLGLGFAESAELLTSQLMDLSHVHSYLDIGGCKGPSLEARKSDSEAAQSLRLIPNSLSLRDEVVLNSSSYHLKYATRFTLTLSHQSVTATVG